MSLDLPSVKNINGSGLCFAVVASRYNESLVNSLVSHASATPTASGADAPLIERVPGAAELPFATATLAAKKTFDAIIVIGVVIAGDTMHHEIIGESTAKSLLEVSLATQFLSSTASWSSIPKSKLKLAQAKKLTEAKNLPKLP